MTTLVNLSVTDFKFLEELGCIMETFDNLKNKVDYVYYYHPKISKEVFRREAGKWEFVRMPVEDIENDQDRGDMERLILKSF